jgi:acyl-CoA thioester hydrolase
LQDRYHDTEIRVRYQETDAMRRVYHAHYLAYFETGRTEMLRAAGGSYRDFEESGRFLVVSEATVRYLKAAGYDDLLVVRTRLARVRLASLEHTYEVWRDGELVATGRTVLVCVDRDGRVTRIPEWLPGAGAE